MIPQELLQQIFLHAKREYPRECCGILFGPGGKPSKIREFKNSQDEYHALDPVNFPRTARQAYWMEPKELLAFQKELRAANEEMAVIYHSHIDAPAYFSAEDKRLALFESEPVYPGVNYLVISVMEGSVREVNLFAWNSQKKEFILLKTTTAGRGSGTE